MRLYDLQNTGIVLPNITHSLGYDHIVALLV